jgi:hypothetical protein
MITDRCTTKTSFNAGFISMISFHKKMFTEDGFKNQTAGLEQRCSVAISPGFLNFREVDKTLNNFSKLVNEDSQRPIISG